MGYQLPLPPPPSPLETRIWTASNDLIDRPVAPKRYLRIGLISLSFFFFFLSSYLEASLRSYRSCPLRRCRFQNVEHSPIRRTRDPTLKPTELYNRRRGIFFSFFPPFTQLVRAHALTFFSHTAVSKLRAACASWQAGIEKRPKMQRASKAIRKRIK